MWLDSQGNIYIQDNYGIKNINTSQYVNTTQGLVPPKRWINDNGVQIPVWESTTEEFHYVNGKLVAVPKQGVAPQIHSYPQVQQGYPQAQTPQVVQQNANIQQHVNSSNSVDSGVVKLSGSVDKPVQQSSSVNKVYKNETKKTIDVGNFPEVKPFVITSKRERVEIDNGKYVNGYYKDYMLDEITKKNINIKQEVGAMRGDSHLYIHSLFSTHEKIEKEQVDVVNTVALKEGYCLTNNEELIIKIFNTPNWLDIHDEITNLKDRVLQKYLDNLITNLLNNNLRFIGLKYYQKLGGYNINMMDSFIDMKKGFIAFNSKIQGLIDPESKYYDEDVGKRIQKVYTETRESIIHAMKANDIGIKDTSYMTEILTEKSCKPVAIPEYMKLILIYGDGVSKELDDIPIGDSRNITPSGNLMRMLTLIKEDDRDKDIPTDYYNIRLYTKNSQLALTIYYNEYIITRLKNIT